VPLGVEPRLTDPVLIVADGEAGELTVPDTGMLCSKAPVLSVAILPLMLPGVAVGDIRV
jgi:hypothetical protein